MTDGPTGYAVRTRDGELLIRTASDSEPAAQINGLILLCGLSPYGTCGLTDQDIAELWDRNKGERTIVPVSIIQS